MQDLARFPLVLHKLFGRTWTFVSLTFDFQINKGLQQDQECINHTYNLHVGPFILIALIQGTFPEFSCIISICNGQSDNTVTIFKDKSYECFGPNTCIHSLKLDIEQMGASSNICNGL